MQNFKTLLSAAIRTDLCTATYPGFSRPTQFRTRQKTILIVTATAFLLQDRPFMEVSIQDIAQQAGCEITSIYARFESKDAILPAVHLVTLENYRPILSETLNPANFEGKGLHDFALSYIRVAANYFQVNQNFVSAVSIYHSNVIEEQFLEMLDAHVKRLSSVIAQIIGDDIQDLIPCVRFGIVQVNAAFRSATTFAGNISAIKPESLARLFTAIVVNRLT